MGECEFGGRDVYAWRSLFGPRSTAFVGRRERDGAFSDLEVSRCPEHGPRQDGEEERDRVEHVEIPFGRVELAIPPSGVLGSAVAVSDLSTLSAVTAG